MFRIAFAMSVLCFGIGSAWAQAPAPKATEKPADAKTTKKDKGTLPTYWKQLGLTDEQVQKVYRLNAKYNEEIDSLEEKIKELKDKLTKERTTILTKEQKDRLEAIIKEKAGTDKK